ALAREGEREKTSGEERHAGHEGPAGRRYRSAGMTLGQPGDDEQREAVISEVTRPGLPNGQHLGRQPRLESVGAEGAGGDGQEHGGGAAADPASHEGFSFLQADQKSRKSLGTGARNDAGLRVPGWVKSIR